MSDVNANISVNIDTSAALGELKNLQRQISQFHNQIAKSSASAAIAQRNLQQLKFKSHMPIHAQRNRISESLDLP